MVEKIKEREVTWLDRTEMIDGRKWIIGDDKYPCKFMVIGERPGRQEDMYNKVLCGEGVGDVLDEVTRAAGFDYTQVYRTNAVKYMVRNDKVGAGDVGRCRPMLDEEIKRVDPSYIVCLGATAFKAVMGNQYRFSDYNGAIIPYPDKPDTLVYVTYNPLNLKHNDGIREDYIRHWRQLAELQRSGSSTVETTGYEVITTPEQVANLGNALFEQFENPLVTLDCEWHGRTWMDPERHIRTIQLGIQPDMAIIIELRDEQGKPLCKDEHLIFPVVGKILSDPRIRLAGHSIISDGEWLLSYDVDIRPRTVIDTMLSEMLLNESGPFGLEMLTLKYTKMGRYDVPLQTWVKANKAACEHGYGPVPRDILLPYAANDVGAPYRIIPAQVAQLQQYGFFNPRNQYPSLFHITMETQRLIYELERTGMLIDVPRLELIMKAYSDRMVQCESMLIEMAASVGMNSFNHRAHAQVRELLFDRLGLTPIKDTKGKPWRNMGSTNSVDAGDATPSTDKNTLELVQEKSPIIKQLMSVRKLDMALKFYLKDDPDSDESTKTGGIMNRIWPDGRTHTHFSQLSETGRFRHSRPNSANMPKKVEGDMAKIFGGKDQAPPGMRTIFVPAPGYVYMEGDFIQAELFVLSGLSGDSTMWDALNTPGKDLHDLTAVSSFKLRVLDTLGKDVSEQHMLDLAKRDKKEFDNFLSTLRYLALSGKIMTRKEFKDTIRVSAKNLNFGIPYGRGPLDIARQVKGETGCDTPLDELEAEIRAMMTVWKNETYPVAWNYMKQCAHEVSDPGYIINPWGRYRRFPKDLKIGTDSSTFEREAQNFPN